MPKPLYTTHKKCKVIGKYRPMEYGIITGTKNHESVGCTIYALESAECAAPFTLTRYHEGHKMLAHGGITASILDETNGYSNHVYEYYNKDRFKDVFTGTATYEYRLPVPVGKPMTAISRVISDDGRKREITGEIIDENGLIYVRSEAIYLTITKEGDDTINVNLLPLEEIDPKEI